MQHPALEIVRAAKSFVIGERVLKYVSLSIAKGEMVMIGAGVQSGAKSENQTVMSIPGRISCRRGMSG